MEYKIGDIVEMRSKDTGNGLPNNKYSVEVELLELDESKNPSGLIRGHGNIMVLYNERYYRSHTNLIISLIKRGNEPTYEIY